MDPILQVQQVSFGYRKEQPLPVVEDVSFEVEEGEYLAVIGHNGSGKSTLAKLMNALVVPTSGTVLVGGMDTAKEDKVLQIRQMAGMVFQNPDNQLVAAVVEEDVAFGPENLGVEPGEIRRRVDEALTWVNMEDYAASAPHNLSGGQKQRIAIAGVIAMRPRILILDEPTAMLDPSGRQEVMDTVMRLNREEGITVILITHFMEEVARADRVLVMDQGRVKLTGTPREIFRHETELREMGLTLPAMTQVARGLAGRGMPLSPDIIDLEEMVDALCPSD
ncbi:energy-coupling factor transporter ATPase [Gehongia tenuis]|uniref:Energy-coupling factor transporter ATPase n=1 Tax=Gehongia tenuis TaxID=2763655 RepID=A0A926D538_9FIRM|nr:energy-coupling factor transporter ATPase [Gehongia tenuis]MBC8531579.1 energy-coupling factor transporter ATPase [Gehongia tenuis]